VHHHLVCVHCGRVVDVYADASAVRVPSPQRHGFTISSTEVVFRGTCPDCNDRKDRNNRKDQRKEGNA
jgi:Fur family ferric uptake transcriptional regulator